MRIYDQAIETCRRTNPNAGDLIQPFNYHKIDGGVCPTLTTRPEGLKTMICVVEIEDETNNDN